VVKAARIGAVAAAALALAAPASAAGPEPWLLAGQARDGLSGAQSGLVLGEPGAAAAQIAGVRRATTALLAHDRQALNRAGRALAAADRAAAAEDASALASAGATVWTTILGAAGSEAVAAVRRGDVAAARAWLLVREFRPPTRFSRAAADATMAVDRLSAGTMTPRAAAAAVRTDLLDTYDGRMRSSLGALADAEAGFDVRRAESAALASGYWSILRPSFVAQRGEARARGVDRAVERLDGRAPVAAAGRVERLLEGFRAAPLSAEEQLRRAGQLERFLKLVPIEYGRGVDDEGRVTLAFEIQEAITFRDGAEAAFRDVSPVLLARGRAATRRVESILDGLEGVLASASRGGEAARAEIVDAQAAEASALLDDLYPSEWNEAAETADFDVISAALDRLEAAVASGEWGRAESARLEAYGVFELGPEQRLRGLAPSLFREVEGYFWYGAGGVDGLVQLLKRKAAPEEISAARSKLDASLADAEVRIGSGPGSQAQVVANSAIIVFREGLEAVLILAALTASLVGAQRRFRRPLFAGAAVALAASVVTWIVAQTVLTSLAAYGERLEAVVSLVAIGVLLLILNWFYHRVYWQENLQGLHRRKKRLLAGAGLSLAAAQVLGLVALGFSSVYREGFETVLFLQALTLEAGAFTVLQGVVLGLVATLLVGLAVVGLERRLPHKKMLIATGLLITWVLVVMVGTTVQTLQKVGWVPVSPIEGLELPYWAGLWLGLYPTWQGVVAQTAAATFVLGSYVLAERLRARRRARIIGSTESRELARSA
jgi:high-affinity iron transporter